jgi:hypothetical protein
MLYQAPERIRAGDRAYTGWMGQQQDRWLLRLHNPEVVPIERFLDVGEAWAKVR